MKNSDNCYGDFDHEKNSDNYDEHESGAVGVPEFSAFRLSVLLEESLSVDLRCPHGSEQEDVEDHERRAGDEVHE